MDFPYYALPFILVREINNEKNVIRVSKYIDIFCLIYNEIGIKIERATKKKMDIRVNKLLNF